MPQPLLLVLVARVPYMCRPDVMASMKTMWLKILIFYLQLYGDGHEEVNLDNAEGSIVLDYIGTTQQFRERHKISGTIYA